MSAKTKVSGVWKDMSIPYIKTSGNWEIAKSAWAKINERWRSWFLQGGVSDVLIPLLENSEFNTNLGIGTQTSDVNSIAIQTDGKVILGGSFSTWDAQGIGRLVRLNTDGTRDTGFTTGSGANSNVRSIAIQPDGKIIIGGSFTTFNGSTVNRIARLNTDRTLDTGFATGTGANFDVRTISIQPDGKIIIGGQFTTFNEVTSRLVRLNADGTIDAAFTTGTGFNNIVISTAIQPDGKILVGGSFTTFNGITVNRLVRLNADGTLDTAFIANIGTGANSNVNSIAVQPDGKIVLGGDLLTFNGVTVNRIVRLNADGTRDTGFTTGSGLNAFITSIALQPDGKIIIGGGFTTFNGVTANRIARLNADGTLDNNFNSNLGQGANNFVNAVATQSDGNIFIGGLFQIINNFHINGFVKITQSGVFTPQSGPVNQVAAMAIQPDAKIIVAGFFNFFSGFNVRGIARINQDGAIDASFNTNIGTGASPIAINSTALQPDGKILVGGSFTTFNGITVNRIVRLNADGTRDTGFATGTGANDGVRSVAIQPDGKIIIGGNFTTFNGVTANRIARLNADGTLDTDFNSNLGAGISANLVLSTAIQSDGKIIIGGSFLTFNGVTVNRIVRLNTDGTRDTSFATGTGASGTILAFALQPDGKILVGGQFSNFNGVTVNRIIRLNTDGTRDTGFTTGSGANSDVQAIAIQSDGKIILGGLFTLFSGTTVNRIVRLNSNGTRDTAFTANTGTGAASGVRAIEIQPDGKIVLGGAFTSFNNEFRSRLCRIGGEIAY